MNDAEVEKYLFASKLPAFKKKVEKSLFAIQRALTYSGQWALNFSGGKDSTVLADLLSRCDWHGKGMYFKYSEYENPEENDKQAEWACQNYGYDIQKLKCYGSYDAWKEVGHFFVAPRTQREKVAAQKCKSGFKKVSTNFMNKNGLQNEFMGLCKDESNSRRISLSMRGSLYFTKARAGYTCCPLADWTAQDIWAYIVSHNLPYLSIYDIPYYSREKIRNELTIIYCPVLLLHGEFLQYRLAYPELYAKLQKEFPEVREYA